MEIDSVDQYLAFGRRLVSAQYVKQRRLAGTAGSHDADELALLLGQIDVPEAQCAVLKLIADVFDLK